MNEASSYIIGDDKMPDCTKVTGYNNMSNDEKLYIQDAFQLLNTMQNPILGFYAIDETLNAFRRLGIVPTLPFMKLSLEVTQFAYEGYE